MRSISGEDKERLADAAKLAELGMPIFVSGLDADGNPKPPEGWEKTMPGAPSLRAIKRWQPGKALCAVTGVVFDVIDIDPRNGGLESFSKMSEELGDDGPEVVWNVATPSDGSHLYVASMGIRKCKPLPGIDLQAGDRDGGGRGFVFLPPTVRPSKVSGKRVAYRARRDIEAVNGYASTVGPLSDYVVRCVADRPGAGNGSGGARLPLDEHAARCLAAEAGAQRAALMAYCLEMKRKGLGPAEQLSVIRELVQQPDWRNFPSKQGPWWPAKRGGQDHWLRGVLANDKTPGAVPDATPEDEAELSGIKPIKVARQPDAEEEAFWSARPILTHVRGWAQARRACPWATLGEVLAEAVCHTPPSLQLPSLVGGNGTLNMLVALTGKSGAGKNAAARAANSAFKWHGVLGSVPDRIPRIPLGSGEGLSKNYGFIRKDKDSGRSVMERLAYSTIVTIPEIDTYQAISNRSGSTLSPELRKFYSGEDIGFGWSDPTKRVIIPEHEYRGCVVAGVQPGRGQTILYDQDSGFAQRWLWLPAEDPYAPDKKPPDPPVADWHPPAIAEDLGVDEGPVVMKVCATALDAIDAARVAGLRGRGDDMESHALYTRLKVAAALALLAGSGAVSDEDWDLSGVVMRVSDRTRDAVAVVLRERDYEANVARGRLDGIRAEAARDTADKEAINRIGKNVLRKMPARSAGWIGGNALRKEIAKRDHELLTMALEEMVEAGRIEAEETTYRGQPGMKYRKAAR